MERQPRCPYGVLTWALTVCLLGITACRSHPSAPIVPGGTRLHVRVFDSKSDQVLPALVSFKDAKGNRVRFGNFTDLPNWGQGASAVELDPGGKGAFAFLDGIAFWKGEGSLDVGRPWKHRDIPGTTTVESSLPFGIYEVQVTHGVEYDAFTATLDLLAGKGQVELAVPLVRSVDSTGYVSADLHVHNAPESPDSATEAASQLKVAAVNGVEVVVMANHDKLRDYADLATQMWPGNTKPLLTISGEEKTGPNSHFGVFPLVADPSKPLGGAPLIRTMPLDTFFGDLRALPEKPIIVVNHPRLGWSAYLDEGFCGAWAKKDFSVEPPCPQNYDAFEVLNGWQLCSSHIRDATESWLQLANFNHISAAVGGSDSHYSAGMVPGYPRTWIRVGNDNVASLTPASIANAIRLRRTVASTAALVTLRSRSFAEGDLLSSKAAAIPISVRVQAPNWAVAEVARLLVNGVEVKSWTIEGRGKSIDFRAETELRLDDSDAFVTLETDSKLTLPPHLVGQYTSALEYGRSKCTPRPGEEPGMNAFATTSPLFIDRDGDGKFRGSKASKPIDL